MESSLTNAFIDSIRNLTERCVAQIEAEAKKFITVVKALHALPPPQQQSSDLQTRMDRLERVVADRVQKSIGSIVEDLDELNERVNKLSSSSDESEAPWIYTPADYLTSSDINEVVQVNPEAEYTVHIDESDHDVVMTVSGVMTAVATESAVTTTVTAVATESAPESAITPPAVSLEDTPVEEEEEEESEESEEDEEEELELEELIVNGTTYMKDPEENVYAIGKDGEIDDTPVGRWVEKKQAIKFYTKH